MSRVIFVSDTIWSGVLLAADRGCLIGDTDKRQQMGIAGRYLAVCEFRVEKVVATHLTIYRQLMEKAKN